MKVLCSHLISATMDQHMRCVCVCGGKSLPLWAVFVATMFIFCYVILFLSLHSRGICCLCCECVLKQEGKTCKQTERKHSHKVQCRCNNNIIHYLLYFFYCS